MNTYAKFLVAAVAVVAVAIVGINLLPGGGVGGPPIVASPSPSTTPTPSAIAIGSPAPTVIFPPAGPLAAGRHTLTEGGMTFSIQVPNGWSSSGANCSSCVTDDGWLQRGPETTDPGSVWAPVWSVDGVVADPCTRAAGPSAQTATELADAVASLPGTDLVTAPEDVTVGGYPAKHVVIKVRDDIACSPGKFFMWGVGGVFRFATGLGETNRVWIVDVDGTRFWFEAETYEGANPSAGRGDPEHGRLDPVRVTQRLHDYSAGGFLPPAMPCRQLVCGPRPRDNASCPTTWTGSSRRRTATTRPSSLSCVEGARLATGSGSSSRRSPDSDEARCPSISRSARWTNRATTSLTRSSGARLRECVGLLLAVDGRSADEIFGPLDAMKVRSSMTLFHRAAPDEPAFRLVLERFYDGVLDPATNERLRVS